MKEPHFSDKFVAFVDILGFKSKVESAEQDDSLSLRQLLDFAAALEARAHSESIPIYGPMICPESQRITRDLDYRVTQVSDCAVVSAEVSPAGIINLITHSYSAALKLLTEGVMVRGYVTRGNIFHEGNKFLGPGYHRALKGEKRVKAFQASPDEIGTPFIEIEPEVVDYIKECDDQCVKMMFERMTRSEGDVTVIFPFQSFSRSNDFHGDINESKRNLEVIRSWIHDARKKVESFAPSSDPDAARKSKYYLKLLDDELAKCEKIEEFLSLLKRPAVKVRHDPENSPGLF